MEKWVLMRQITSRVDPDDKKMKINWFNPKKIVIGTVQGNQLLYIDSQV